MEIAFIENSRELGIANFFFYRFLIEIFIVHQNWTEQGGNGGVLGIHSLMHENGTRFE